jgi:hypothetical protein
MDWHALKQSTEKQLNARRNDLVVYEEELRTARGEIRAIPRHKVTPVYRNAVVNCERLITSTQAEIASMQTALNCLDKLIEIDTRKAHAKVSQVPHP